MRSRRHGAGYRRRAGRKDRGGRYHGLRGSARLSNLGAIYRSNDSNGASSGHIQEEKESSLPPDRRVPNGDHGRTNRGSERDGMELRRHFQCNINGTRATSSALNSRGNRGVRRDHPCRHLGQYGRFNERGNNGEVNHVVGAISVVRCRDRCGSGRW